MKNYSISEFNEKIKEAYSRFKAYVYYDNFNLILREELATYEVDGNLNIKLLKLSKELFEYLNGQKLSNRIQKLIKGSGYIVLPKKFENASGSQKINSILISNQLNEDFRITDNTILFAGDIELQIIATLWVMEEGILLQDLIGKDSYGYHLPLNSEKTQLGPEKLLFTKYFEKYQEWRDKGIRAAKIQIDEGNEIMLISLDIKNFYHSAQINFDELKHDLKILTENSLTAIIESICIQHTSKLNMKSKSVDMRHPILPIGLVSSGVIANWLLIDFDKALKDKMAPVYYGRYVDDIFIVISNIKPPKEILIPQDIQSASKKVIEWLSRRFFTDNNPLKIEESKGDLNLIFSATKYHGLKIQADKLRIYYFSPDWPHAMLNKFQKALAENSSAFWFLPDEEDLKISLDDEAYDMRYEDTINKFRSVSDVKASKYGASVFLAKRIKLAILHNGSSDEKITKEVFRFFKGVAVLAYYNMWEKVFTYLVVTNDLNAIRKLQKQILGALERLSAKEMEVELKATLQKYLIVCLELAFSLNPAILDVVYKNSDSLQYNGIVIREGIKKLRKGLLTRHHYLPLPSLILTNYYRNTLHPLLGENIFSILLDEHSDVTLNDEIKTENWRIPRWIHLQEICIYFFLSELRKWKSDGKYIPFHEAKVDNKNNINYTDLYTLECIKLFELLNNRNISKYVSTTPYIRYGDNTTNEPNINTNIISILGDLKSPKFKLGLTNMKIESNDLKKAILSKSSITKEKRSKHIKLLNTAEEEKIDLLILPETSVPLEWLFAYSDEARRKQRAFIFGLEHFTFKNYCFNFSIGLFPIETGAIKEVFVIPRLKNHYSPNEENEIKKAGKHVPRPNTSFYHLIKWKEMQFTIYNCYELADVVHRGLFRSELDILFAIEYNKDTNYFSNIAESTCRDLHCYFVQANSSDFGDSRVVEPRQSERMNPVRVKGGENNVILRYELDIKGLRDFQSQRLPYQMDDKSFKTTPPNFDHEQVSKRAK